MADGKSDTTIANPRWFIIRRLARHVFLCWPRRWSFDYLGRGEHDLCSFRRTCLSCGIIHERDV